MTDGTRSRQVEDRSGCRAPGDSRQQTLDDTSAGIGADQVHRRAASEGTEVPVQPASGLVPVGEGPLGECQSPRHGSGAIGLVDRKPAAIRPPVRQGTRLDDEGAQVAPGDAALSESVDRLDVEPGRNRADRFEAIFGGTDIARSPTANRHRYVILRFDFSAFDDTLETLRQRFETYCFIKLRSALERNRDLFQQPVIDRILAHPSIDGRLNELFDYVVEHGIALYVLIDEYDNFANTILAYRGAEAYESFTHGGGFYRNFFATLKAGTGHGGGVERIFITGVSPITMDDVTSGFNIGTNVSLMPEFNEVLGFTAAEVRAILESYRDHGVFDQDVDEALAVMSEWYDGYRFAKRAQQDVYNTDMVLYYLKASVPGRGKPDDLIDTNVRIDYGKLRHLLTVNRQLNGNFDLLRHLIGAGWVDGELRSAFPLEELDQRDNFVSLLHYFGLLSIREVRDGMPRLAIPNQTVRRLMYGYLRDGYRDVGVFATSSTAKR